MIGLLLSSAPAVIKVLWPMKIGSIKTNPLLDLAISKQPVIKPLIEKAIAEKWNDLTVAQLVSDPAKIATLVEFYTSIKGQHEVAETQTSIQADAVIRCQHCDCFFTSQDDNRVCPHCMHDNSNLKRIAHV